MRTALLLALTVGVSACTHPWMPVLRGMEAEKVVAELAQADRDFNAKAPKSMAPSDSNEWVLFIYDPKEAPEAHAAFASFEKDCFFGTVQYEDVDDDAPRPRHAAICARERTPKPP